MTPLSDLRVIEMGQLLAGPFCGQLLADFGAEVIKVEPPGVGDPMREWGREKSGGKSLWWPVVARGKKSMTLNLREAAGQEMVRELVASDADILVENFRPGTLETWNLAPADLQAINPRLIVVRVSGYGQDGPYASRPGYGAIGEAMGGLRAVIGEPDRPPSRAGISIGDTLAATFACVGCPGGTARQGATPARARWSTPPCTKRSWGSWRASSPSTRSRGTCVPAPGRSCPTSPRPTPTRRRTARST